MEFPKKYTIEHGDSVQVEAHGPDSVGEVELFVKDSGRDVSTLLFVKPDKARKIAKALLKAANVAEGLPQKAEKPKLPTMLIDDEGDVWHLDENGETYTYSDAEDGYTSLIGKTYDEVAEHWGIRTEAHTR